MRALAVLTVLALAGCENPSLGIGASISGSGVSVSPSVSGSMGNARVTVSG